MSKIIVMFSGGLDSTVAIHLLKSQGIDVTALHFVLPFYAGIGVAPAQIVDGANALGVELRLEEEGEEFLEMIRSPKFGFGKNANPCIDCRMHRLQKASRIAEEMGAACIATGEVVGQRPMSQKLNTIKRIEKNAGLKGKVLRPLSAKLLEPTEVELAGIVDREKLLDISGRSRAVQLAYAKQYNLVHGAPAGGCILTNVETGARFMDLTANDPQFTLTDFKLLAYGRHFRTSPDYRVIIARDNSENEALEKIVESPVAVNQRGVVKMYLRDATGPVAFGLGELSDDNLRFSAAAVARFSKLRGAESAAVIINGAGVDNYVIDVKPASETELDKYRVSSGKW